MAKGYDKHKERMDAIAALGRPLARRSRSQCELCETSGVPLAAYEVPPLPDEPALETTLFLCEPCGREIQSTKILDAARLRVLEKTVWSELPAAQVVAVRWVRRLANDGEAWARELLENLYLDEEVEAWADRER
ncbi:MAG: phnA protein [Planctomycetota bacterium]